MNINMRKKAGRLLRLISFFWITLVIVALMIIIVFYLLNNAITNERNVQMDKLEIIVKGYQLAKYSNYLTAQIRSYTVTHNPVYMQKYWQEVEIDKHRNATVSYLIQAHALPEVVNLLIIAKRNSDNLIKKETHAMKLVLEAYNVPTKFMHPEVAAYHLSATEKQLTPDAKLKLAQKLVFDKAYTEDKDKIAKPIAKFLKLIRQRTDAQEHRANSRTDNLTYLLWVLIIVMLIQIVAILWMRTLHQQSEQKQSE